MGLDRRRSRERGDVQPEIRRCLAEIRRRDIAKDERSAIELVAARLEAVFGDVDLGVLEL